MHAMQQKFSKQNHVSDAKYEFEGLLQDYRAWLCTFHETVVSETITNVKSAIRVSIYKSC